MARALLFIVAFLLGLLAGWIVWGRRPRPATSATLAPPRQEPGTPETVGAAVADEPPAAVVEPAAVPPEPMDLQTPEPEPLQPEPLQPEPLEPEPLEPEPAVFASEPVVAVVEPEPQPVVVVEPEPEPELLAVQPQPVTQAEPVAAAEPIAAAEPVAAEPVAPAEPITPAVAATHGAPVDDLQRIEGIGPKISGVLVAAGIRTFTDLAATDLTRLTVVLRQGGIRFAPTMSSWGEQADLLARGDLDGFRALTDLLVSGRKAR